MKEALNQAQSIAASDGTVLLLGESGSGKDYLARWIHENSRRSDGRFFSVNCAAFSGELADSELFGHEAGAFTGARTAKKGVLQLAEGGTLLLNEIGEFSLPLQAKLLTFLDTKSFLKVGGERPGSCQCPHHGSNPPHAHEGGCRGPLPLRVVLPPQCSQNRCSSLARARGGYPDRRERNRDPAGKRNAAPKGPGAGCSLLGRACALHWPGNVRELRNVLERAIMLWKGGSLHIDTSFLETSPEIWSHNVSFDSERSLPAILGEVAKAVCTESLRRCNGNKTEAARLLGISRGALYRSMRRSGLSRDFGT